MDKVKKCPCCGEPCTKHADEAADSGTSLLPVHGEAV